MKIISGPAAMNLKLILIVIGATIALATLYYTQNLVTKLQERERQIVQLYANSLEYATNSNDISSDFTFIFENIIRRIDFPMIVTDGKNKIISIEEGKGFKNIKIDIDKNELEKENYLRERLNELTSTHQPINVKTPDGIIIQKIFYGDSDIIKQLKYYPYLQILFALLFIVIAYSSFSYIKKSEQSNIWVGMSKETAHQLGTPISSLLGWTEILRMHYNNPDKVLDSVEEIENDLSRLKKITKRFSKIGSKPELVEDSPYEIIERVVRYFERRLPHLGKNVTILIEGEKNVKTKLNSELFEWVIENLIKNALDAIESKQGKIQFLISSDLNQIEIDVTDNGKGIEHHKRKDIFRPGYSTKRRGWGLGLSLSKRIIENYHNGKIFVKQSIVNEGTTFKIILDKSEKIT
ncbi:MAG: HAMP domain-containing sensor histidine kinase [Melioribacteraceae bacterium]|jgi:signal transduction histidine kinase|nr:HAMP domain-containing sensor histidine kinase [Melioribacteraceae bacterium]